VALELSPVSFDGVEPLANLLGARPGHLLYDFAVPHENKGRPQFDLKRSTERFAFAIFDHEVSDIGILLKEGRQLRPDCAAETSPFRAKLKEYRALHPVDFVPGRLLIS
jgi:hypothetical protein